MCTCKCSPKRVYALVCAPKCVCALICALVCAPKLICALVCAPNLVCVLVWAPKFVCALGYAPALAVFCPSLYKIPTDQDSRRSSFTPYSEENPNFRKYMLYVKMESMVIVSLEEL